MPWVIDPENEHSPLNRVIERYRKPVHSAYKRLYALGMDAYSLVPRITELVLRPASQYAGKTGYLKIDRKGQVHRRLIWAKFIWWQAGINRCNQFKLMPVRSGKTSYLRGRWAEQAALEYLQTNNLKLLEKNFRSIYGEIDLVMLDKDIYNFH